MTAENEKCTIVLEDDQSALVLSADGSLEFYLPEMGDEDVVPEHAALIAAIATRLEDDGGFRDGLLGYLGERITAADREGTVRQYEQLTEGESMANWAIRDAGFLGSIKQLTCCARCGDTLPARPIDEPRHFRDIFKPTFHCLCDGCFEALP